MILECHSDVSYLSEPNERIQAGGHLFLSENNETPTNNGEVLNISLIIIVVMSLAVESESRAIYINACEFVQQIISPIEMGHPQPITPMYTNNLAAHSVVMKNINPRRTKAMDINFHWLRCQDSQGEFRYYWQQAKQNLAD